MKCSTYDCDKDATCLVESQPSCRDCALMAQVEDGSVRVTPLDCRPDCACAVPGDPGDGCYGCDVYESKGKAQP